MNKKIVAFALSTTALLGAGAIAETTPMDGFAVNSAFAYETESERVESGTVGTASYDLYQDGTVVIGAGEFTASELRAQVDECFMACNSKLALVFESGATVTDSAEQLLAGNLSIKSVSGELTVNGSMQFAFKGCASLETVDLSTGAGSEVTSIANMFQACTSLTKADLSGFDTSSAMYAHALFYDCTALETVDLTGFDLSSAKSVDSMFSYCGNLKKLELPGFVTATTTSVSGMFMGCSSLESIDVSGWDISGVTMAYSVFEGCSSLASLDLSDWDPSNVNSFYASFWGMTGLKSLDLTGWQLKEGAATTFMFDGMTALEKLTLGGESVDIVKLIPAGGEWVMRKNQALGQYTLGDLAAAWDNSTMAGTWYLASSMPAIERLSVYRLYNPNSGEHFYTLSEVERDATVAAGWNDEGIGWIAPDESIYPVYRLYSGTDHHYTMDVEERDALIEEGWVDEGIAFYSADPATGIALLRQFNPNVDPEAATNNSGSHNYTTDQAENDYLVSIGWQAEDVAFYGMAPESE